VWRSVLTLGTFDGVHRGHQALIREVVRRARAHNARSVVLSFGLPPRHAGEPLARPVLLTTLSEKIQILKRLGIDTIQVLVFDRKTAATFPEDFFRQTVLRKHRAVEMVVGPRVAFGRKRAGRLPLLRRLGREHGVRIHLVHSISGARGVVASRLIRRFLTSGHIEKANALLGYPYSVSGLVVHGDHRGRHLGFPTANIEAPPEKMMPRGVFWVKVLASDTVPLTVREALRGADGLCNVGIRPTFTPQSHVLHCEVFLLHKRKKLYGHRLRVVFLRRIRAEKRFSSAAALKRQIREDVAAGRKLARLYRKSHFSI